MSRRADSTPPPAASRLATADVAAVLTALARAALAADETPAVVALRDVRIWLNGVAAQARAAQRRPARCPHCHAELAFTGEVADLLTELGVEL